jgi:choline-glycine betaine transporter
MQRKGTDLAGQATAEGSLFAMLSNMPWATVTSILVMLLVAIFFVSGADAASIVMGTLSERGTLAPSRKTVIFWGAATGAVAAVMLLVGGQDALSGLQNITIVAALPFLIVMVGLAISLVKDLNSDPLIVRREIAVAAIEQAVVTGVTEHGDDFALVVEEAPAEQVATGTAADDAETATGRQNATV